jgi:hypothetical protein
LSVSMRVLPISPRTNVTPHHISSLNNSGSKTYVTNDCHGIQGSIWRQSHRAYEGIIASQKVKEAQTNFMPSPSR